MKANPLPGEVWAVDFGYDGKVRSALVVSVADKNCRLAIASVLQITTQYGGTPYELTLPPVAWLPTRAKLLQCPNRAAGGVA